MRTRIWANRIELESYMHAESMFCTLTYSDEHLPPGANLSPRDIGLFLKRLRKSLPGIEVRYFIAGEYGDQTLRPHYHAILFGVFSSFRGAVQTAWGKGLVNWKWPGVLMPGGGSYAAKYVCKSRERIDDPRLRGRVQEFARMSRMPGLGFGAVGRIANALRDQYGRDLIAQLGDVPGSVRIGGREWPLGRYLREKLRIELGYQSRHDRRQGVSRQVEEKLQTLRAASSSFEEFDQKVKAMEAQRVLNAEAKARIFGKKGYL